MSILTDGFTAKKPIGRIEYLKLSLFYVFLFAVLALCVTFFIKDKVSQIVILVPIASWSSFCIHFKRLWHVTASKNNAAIWTIVYFATAYLPLVQGITSLAMLIVCLFVPGQPLEDIEDYYPNA